MYAYEPVYSTNGTIGLTTASSITTVAMTNFNGSFVDYNFIPSEVKDAIDFIMGKPGGAKFLISYAYKKAKDPVIFIHSKKAMLIELKKLLKDDRVDKRTVLVSEISRQFKPTKKMHKKALGL